VVVLARAMLLLNNSAAAAAPKLVKVCLAFMVVSSLHVN
jgi:hypothetical protein